MKSDYKDDHFVLCNHCLPVTVCYTFPLPESGFDREKREKGKIITIWPIFYKRNRWEMKKSKKSIKKYKNALKGSAKL
jgi:hypothetical protein